MSADQVIVINKRDRAPEGYSVVYIGRPSPLGNPFVIGKEGNRAQVIELYQMHLLEAMCGPTPENEALWALIERARGGERLALQCWCAPLNCHGHVIQQEINRALALSPADA